MSETCRGHLWEKIIVKLFASSWYIFLTYIYDARSHLYQEIPCWFVALIQTPTFSRRHTKTHADINRCHSERDCHRSTSTQLWNADMSTSSNHTKDFVQWCHGKHTVASSRTLLSCHVRRVKYTVVVRLFVYVCDSVIQWEKYVIYTATFNIFLKMCSLLVSQSFAISSTSV